MMGAFFVLEIQQKKGVQTMEDKGTDYGTFGYRQQKKSVQATEKRGTDYRKYGYT